MRGNLTVHILWKLILLFIVSIFLSIVTVYVIRALAQMMFYAKFSGWPIVRAVYVTFGKETTVFMLGAIFFIVFFGVFIRKTVVYLSRIKETVKEMSHGSFHLQIPVNANHELGELAEYINRMCQRLKTATEEEHLAIQAKNELITNVSHDLRTPLTSIIGYLRWIEEDRCKDEIELRHYTGIIYEKSLRLGRMVEDLFEYTRMNHGTVHMHFDDINLMDLLGQLTAEFTLQIQDKQMTIQLDFAEEELMVHADGDKLMRVFENLVMNAIKYGEQGRFIVISVRKIQECAVIRIVNYGPPIPVADMQYIFERFYREEKSRSDQTGGSGLGLAIAKSIIELHLGTITVESNHKETAFEVRIPLSSPFSAYFNPNDIS